jgi:hypothetical protein
MDLAIALTEDRLIRDATTVSSAQDLAAWRHADDPDVRSLVDGEPVSMLQFGNAFCERLLPSKASLRRALAWAERANLGFSLVTPTLTDAGIKRLRALARGLPEGTEIVANDWGAVRLVRAEFPSLAVVVGRVLCKMLKDPRVPSAKWTQLGACSLGAPGFRALLARFRVDRVETDLPPFPRPEELEAPGLKLAVHAPFGFATKGRVCRIGSLGHAPARKFALDHGCRKECLTYVAELERSVGGSAGPGLRCIQRGNAIFYRHSPSMTGVLATMVEAGKVDRVVISGDWNESRRADRQRG